MKSLFKEIESSEDLSRPLADVLRPSSIDKVVGQKHITGKAGYLSKHLKSGKIPSVVLWGPPGCGKTTIAKLIAHEINYHFECVSAVTNGTADLKKLFLEAKARKNNNKYTLLMVDEIHRFNRAQQDVLLPFVEDGTVTLVGATTENPSFELNAALLSRCKVLVLKRLETDDLKTLIERAEEHYQKALPVTDKAKNILCNLADGDGRYILGLCEELFAIETKKALNQEELLEYIQKRMPIYDKHQDSHYNLISALHKSLRGSDVDAALYWFNRMLEGGEEPLYIARRLIRFAVEDIGMADPNALLQVQAAKDAFYSIGSPEGELAIAQAVIYLATAPKSNAAYTAFKKSAKHAKIHGSLMPPKHILNAPTKLMKEEGYGKGYKYDHDENDSFSGQDYFPEEMERENYYHPKEIGFEREIIKRLSYWQKLREQKQ